MSALKNMDYRFEEFLVSGEKEMKARAIKTQKQRITYRGEGIFSKDYKFSEN